MAFVILRTKSGWRIRHDRYEEGRRLSRRIPIKDYRSIGFSESLTLEQARERAKQLTATEGLKRQENSRQRIKDRLKAQDMRIKALLPLEEDFRHLLDTERKQMQWRAARDLIIAIPVQLEHWHAASSQFHALFVKLRHGADYARRLLKLINEYGAFVARTQNRYFKEIKPLSGLAKERVVDGSRKQKSLPLAPQELEAIRSRLKEEHYNWLYISIWMGLRPEEIDNPCTFEIQGDREWAVVYQSKLITKPKNERYKMIPKLFPEQEKAFRLMESGPKERPTGYVMGKVTEGVGLYGGRHGFVKLMKSRGRKLAEISMWMGHTNINRTRNDYMDKRVGFLED